MHAYASMSQRFHTSESFPAHEISSIALLKQGYLQSTLNTSTAQ
jgi:hypothetical protein